MINDILTIRADQDNYDYGYDDLFSIHPEVVERLCADAANIAVAAFGWLDLALKNRGSRAKACELLVKRLMQDGIGKTNKATTQDIPRLLSVFVQMLQTCCGRGWMA